MCFEACYSQDELAFEGCEGCLKFLPVYWLLSCHPVVVGFQLLQFEAA